MQRLFYYILYPFIWLLSKAPFGLLYVISDIVFFVVFYLMGYRKKVVLNNLQLAFPKKTKGELLYIRRKFYSHFIDIFMEMIKTFTISERELIKRYRCKNMELIERLEEKNKSVVLLTSHYGNWEWGVGIGSWVTHRFYGIFTEVENRIFADKIKRTRERFGAHLLVRADTIREFIRNYKNEVLSMYAFISDQSPMLHKSSYWTNFMGIKVPVHIGAEILAKRYDCSVIYGKIDKIKRGYYEVHFELLAENPKDFPDYQITDKYLRRVEEQIYKNPIYYFWTHKRFKHRGKEKKIRKK